MLADPSIRKAKLNTWLVQTERQNGHNSFNSDVLHSKQEFQGGDLSILTQDKLYDWEQRCW